MTPPLTNPRKKNHFRRSIKVIAALGVGLILLWLISRGQDFGLIYKEFKEANYRWILLALLASVISHLLRAVRWNLLVDSLGYATKASHTFHAVMTGYLSNLAIPRMGEITRCVVLGRLTGAPFNALVGTVVAERVIDAFCLGTIIFLTIAFQFDFLKGFLHQFFFSPLIRKGEANWISLLVLLIFGVTAGVLLLVVLKNRLRSPEPGSLSYKIRRQLSGLKNGLLTVMHIRRKWLFFLYTLTIWGFYFLTVYLIFFAIEATSHLTVSAGITLLAVGSLGIVAPVPGGIGTYHFLTMITLGELYGIAPEPALSYAYIAHASQTLVILVAGTIAWTSLSFKKNITSKKSVPSVDFEHDH